MLHGPYHDYYSLPFVVTTYSEPSRYDKGTKTLHGTGSFSNFLLPFVSKTNPTTTTTTAAVY